MDPAQVSTPHSSQTLPLSASSSDTTSSASSFFSKGHPTRSGSNASSIASSPAVRDSLDMYNSSKRHLTDVKEEPLELQDAEMMEAAGSQSGDEQINATVQSPAPLSTANLPSVAHYDFNENETAESPISAASSFKKRRSGDSPASVVANRIGTRFPSFSRQWKSKTGGSPKLSIITHTDTTRSRTNSVSSQLVSPALSVISKHESLLCSSPAQAGPEESSAEAGSALVNIEEANAYFGQDEGQATTPLLPPIMMDISPFNMPVQSPLQSPTVAETPTSTGCATPSGTPQLPCLPSPPLSTKPSIASIRQRSRAGTVVPSSEIPPLQMLGEGDDDQWSVKLGHANFTIHPEPYLPKVFDMETFKQLRENWDQARHSYAKHLARTGEHYGTTSKTYLLTEEKWASIDATWQKNTAKMTDAIGPLIARSSSGEADGSDSSCSTNVLEQPPSRVIVPRINDATGKFPDMGDEDIVGPMAVGPSRAATMQQLLEPTVQNRLSKKRNFLKFFSDFLGRGVGSGLRT
ncbi:hypothetical protein EPUS_04568 [Endocarpon pusillum Z07020]|uniref:Only prolin and serin are matching in the corresponding protein n=1 Tax=Endocarpon pusillum (strain Z07020 / HMAS-L-300199) TaxID=1263415 RepID=U1GT48_ENDPU|nr:uncharacterized protein EPUS_04568 [Endocarpon pusillum Z07020]ERF75588.1 hypothetical protein EPUS_04568 [Endocarpon pusillum Z07020]